MINENLTKRRNSLTETTPLAPLKLKKSIGGITRAATLAILLLLTGCGSSEHELQLKREQHERQLETRERTASNNRHMEALNSMQEEMKIKTRRLNVLLEEQGINTN